MAPDRALPHPSPPHPAPSRSTQLVVLQDMIKRYELAAEECRRAKAGTERLQHERDVGVSRGMRPERLDKVTAQLAEVRAAGCLVVTAAALKDRWEGAHVEALACG